MDQSFESFPLARAENEMESAGRRKRFIRYEGLLLFSFFGFCDSVDAAGNAAEPQKFTEVKKQKKGNRVLTNN